MEALVLALAVTLFQLKLAGLPSSSFAIKQALFENETVVPKESKWGIQALKCDQKQS